MAGPVSPVPWPPHTSRTSLTAYFPNTYVTIVAAPNRRTCSMATQPTPDQHQPIPPSGPTFVDDFTERGNRFAEDALKLIPELETVVVIPVWSITQDHAPWGLVRGRGGNKRSLAELHRTLYQLHGVFQSQTKVLGDYLREFDRYANQLSQDIHAKTEELRAINAAIDAKRPPTIEQHPENPGPGEPAGGPSPGGN